MSKRVPDDRKAEILRLRYDEGLSTRAIAKKLSMSRRTIREMLGERKPRAAAAPSVRESILAPYEPVLRAALEKGPELRAPAMLERLRAVGYTGGITVVRERMRVLRPRPALEVFS